VPVLPAKFAEQGVARSLVTSEAFIGDDAFFISYESEDGLIFAGGNWSDRIDIAAVEGNTDGTYRGPYILPLDYQQRERWGEIPGSPIRPGLLNSEQWDRFRDDLFSSILPHTEKIGVVMHFDNDDYFLYFNEVDRFEAEHELLKIARWPGYEGEWVIRVPDAVVVVVEVVFVPDAVAVSVDSGRRQESILDCSQEQT